MFAGADFAFWRRNLGFKFLRFLRISLKFAEQFARKMQNLQILGAKFENFKRQI